jgi:type III secretion system low calcium response chaperone LcrH/SycD
MEIENVADVKAVQESVLELLGAGGTLGDLCEYTDQDYEAVYQLGSNFYSQGKYVEAYKAFGFLVLNNHLDGRFIFSFAACCQMLKRYEDAVRCYAIAALLAPNDPMPSFRMAECMVALGMTSEAVEMFQIAIEEAGSGHEALKTRATALRSLLLAQ